MSIAPISLLGMLFVSSGTPHVATVGADANRARDFDEAIIVCNETYLPNSMAHTNKDDRDQRSRLIFHRTQQARLSAQPALGLGQLFVVPPGPVQCD